jgi:WD40 repeat protein
MKTLCGINLACTLSLAALGGASQPVGPRLDRHGDPLPKGALQRLGTLRYRQSTPIVAFAFAPDGKTYATANHVTPEFAVNLWSTTTGRLLLRCDVLHGRRPALAFTADDKNAVAVRKKVIEPLIEPLLAFAPDGKTVAAAVLGDLVLWDTNTGRLLRQLPSQLGRISGLAWSPDGKTFAVAGWSWKANPTGPRAHLIDAQTGKVLHTFDWHRTPTTGLAFSPDGKKVLIRSMDRFDAYDGFVGMMPGCVRVYDTATGNPVYQLDRNLVGRRNGWRWGDPVAWTRDLSRLARLARDGHIQVWDLAAGTKVCALARDGTSCSFAFTPDGKRLVVGADWQALNVWDAATGQHLGDLVGHGDRGRAVAGIDPTGTYLATMMGGPGFDHFVRLWDLASGQELTGKAGHQDTIVFAQAAADGKRVVTGAVDGTIRLWDSATGQPLQVHAPGWPRPIALSPDGSLLFARDHEDTLAILEGPTWKLRTTLKRPDISWSLPVLAPDGDLVAVHREDEPVRLYNTSSGKKLLSLPAAERPWAFSPDGQLLAAITAESGQLRLWHVRAGKAVLAFQVCQRGGPPDFNPNETVDGLAFSTDGRWLATSHVNWGHGHGLRIWEVVTGRLVQEVKLPCAAYCLAFSPDGWTVAASTFDQRGKKWGACFWGAANGQLLGQVEGHAGVVTTMAFAPDQRTFLTGSTDGTVLVWDVGALASARPAPRKLTPAELNALWEDLAGSDARKAYQVIVTLAAGGQDSVAFLQDRLQPTAFLPLSQLEPLVTDLDNPQYAVRAKAMVVLGTQGERAALVLRQALKEGISLEMRRRVELLLVKLENFTPAAPQLQQLRALAVLEHIGDAQANKIIEVLTGGAPEARLTQQATAALARLKKMKAQ